MPSSLNGTGVTFNDSTTLQSGNIPTANLGSGTANSTTFLRGDKTWAAPSGGTDVQTFNSSGTWTKPASGSMARIQVWGGGGGAGRGNEVTRHTGGGGGGYNEITVPLASLASTVSVTVGAGGAGRTGSTGNGSNGGTSSFGTVISAFGGGGGSGANAVRSMGGGGGGPLSAGTTANVVDTLLINVLGRPHLSSGGGEVNQTDASPSAWHGGTNLGGTLGDAVYGGGAGSNGPVGDEGLSVYGGNGGARNSAGVQPGGGGGASSSANGNGSNGGAGRVIVTVW